MWRERALKVVLVLVGLLFTANGLSLGAVCEARASVGDDDEPLRHTRHFPAASARNPSANGSLIAFTAWSSFAHAAVMSFRRIVLAERGAACARA
jgi:hypothetical protein